MERVYFVQCLRFECFVLVRGGEWVLRAGEDGEEGGVRENRARSGEGMKV